MRILIFLAISLGALVYGVMHAIFALWLAGLVLLLAVVIYLMWRRHELLEIEGDSWDWTDLFSGDDVPD